MLYEIWLCSLIAKIYKIPVDVSSLEYSIVGMNNFYFLKKYTAKKQRGRVG